MGRKRSQWLNTEKFISLSCYISNTALDHPDSKTQTNRAAIVWKFSGCPNKVKESPRNLRSRVECSGLGVKASIYNSLARVSRMASSNTGKTGSNRNGVLEKVGELH